MDEKDRLLCTIANLFDSKSPLIYIITIPFGMTEKQNVPDNSRNNKRRDVMKLRRSIAVLTFMIMLLSLVGCSSTEDNVPKSDTTQTQEDSKAETQTEQPKDEVETSTEEKVTLRMAWWGSQTRHDITVKVIEMYEALNPNIDIEYEFYDFDGYITKLNTLVAANDVWDIFQLGGNFPTYLDKIVPMNDFITSGIVDVSNIHDSFLQTTRYNDSQLSLASGVNTYGIAYDPQMFIDAGVPLPTENWTWDDFKQAALTIHEKLGIYGSSKLEDFIAGASMGISQEGFDKNFFAPTNDALGFDDPSMLVDYIAMRKELVDAGAYPDPGALAEIKDIEGDYLVTGEAAMTWVATNQMPTLAKAAGREIKLAVLPRKTANGPSGIAIQSSQMLCISKDSKAPAEAAKFINYFINDVEANKVLNGERGASIVETVREELIDTADEAKTEMYNYLSLVGGFETGVINVISPPQQAEIQDQYKLLLEQVIYNEKTPEEAALDIYNFAKEKFAQ